MAPHRNLQPGTPAPQTGLYVCGFCAPGGMLETLSGGMAGLRGAAPPYSSSNEVTAQVEAGVRLPPCERCGVTAGWDLLDGPIEDYRRGRAAGQQAVFAELGLDQSPRDAVRPERPAVPDLGQTRSTPVWVLAAGVIVIIAIVVLVVLLLLL